MDGTRIAPMLPEHWSAVERIYAEGLATGDASFQTAAPTRSEFDDAHLAEPRLVARADGEVLGWAALSPVSTRPVYAGVVECSVYVAEAARGAGVGRSLLVALTEAADAAGIWTIQAGIFPENAASLALHHCCGFRTVGRPRAAGPAPRRVAGRGPARAARPVRRLNASGYERTRVRTMLGQPSWSDSP